MNSEVKEMSTGDITPTIEYRLVVVQSDSRKVLSCKRPGHPRRLPSIRVPPNARAAAHLREAVLAEWGIRGIVVDYLPSDTDHPGCAVLGLSSVDRSEQLRPIRIEDVSEDDLSQAQRLSLIALIRGRAQAPVSRLGWLHEAIAWVEKTSGEKISRVEEIEQLNAGGGFALLRFPTEGGQSYWVKATGSPNAHELPVSVFLSKLYPSCVPKVL